MLDKIVKAYDVRGVYPDDLNEELAWRLGFATAQYLRSCLTAGGKSTYGTSLAIGRDMRTSGPALMNAFIRGVTAAHMPVVDIGMIDTSQIYFAINHLGTLGGVQTTASHNPGHYNGFKISGQGGKPVGANSGLNEIKKLALSARIQEVDLADNVQQVDLAEQYRQFILSFYKPAGRRIKLAVDASNGMAGKWFPILFGDADLDVTALNFEHDGEFVHDPNPLVEANLAQLKQAIADTGADLGICFDGDADRCVVVDETGASVPGDILTALLAKRFLAQSPGSTVVYDLRSSRIVKDVIEQAGGQARRERVGHAFMKKTLAETDGVFGGELSGHFYFRDNWYCDNGFLAFVQVLNILGETDQPFSTLLEPLKAYSSSGERNFRTEDKDGAIQKLAAKFSDAEIDYLDGITIQYDKWWCNVRKSNTEPLLRLNLEADNDDLLQEKLAAIEPLLGQQVDH